jgi:hypothetical protein
MKESALTEEKELLVSKVGYSAAFIIKAYMLIFQCCYSSKLEE